MGAAPLTSRVFTKLLALFVLLLVFQTVVMEFVFRRLVEHYRGRDLHLLGREALWSGLIALAVALPLAAWVASRMSSAPCSGWSPLRGALPRAT